MEAAKIIDSADLPRTINFLRHDPERLSERPLTFFTAITFCQKDPQTSQDKKATPDETFCGAVADSGNEWFSGHTLVSSVTHVALAFMRSEIFNAEVDDPGWPLFANVEDVRAQFSHGTAIMVAIGGWGNTEGFAKAAASDHGRKRFARNVRKMIDATGADGVDIDWEYPGGNGEDYKQIPNADKSWEVDAYPQLLAEIRGALGENMLLSAAVPGLPRDMIAFDKKHMSSIVRSVDFLNIMTYDLMNRRDNVTKHHTGVEASKEAIEAYLENGLPAAKANLGLAFYVKWFKTDPKGGCEINPVACKTALLEDPETGADLGRAGAFSWHDNVPSELSASFSKAMKHGQYDSNGGGHSYWDPEEQIFWSWDTSEAIRKKIPVIFEQYRLGGVFAWGLGEDAPRWKHLASLTAALEKQNHVPAQEWIMSQGKDEL